MEYGLLVAKSSDFLSEVIPQILDLVTTYRLQILVGIGLLFAVSYYVLKK